MYPRGPPQAWARGSAAYPVIGQWREVVRLPEAVTKTAPTVWFGGLRTRKRSFGFLIGSWGPAEMMKWRPVRIFARTVGACVEAGIAGAELVHNDAALTRADVAWET